MFLAAPFVGLISVTLVSTILWLADAFAADSASEVILVESHGMAVGLAKLWSSAAVADDDDNDGE